MYKKISIEIARFVLSFLAMFGSFYLTKVYDFYFEHNNNCCNCLFANNIVLSQKELDNDIFTAIVISVVIVIINIFYNIKRKNNQEESEVK